MQNFGTVFIPSSASRTIRSILVATDLSPESTKVIHHAIEIARTFDAVLHVFHVVSSVGYTLCGPEVLEQATQIACREMDELRTTLVCAGSLSIVRSSFTVRQGHIAPQVEQFAREEDIDLILVGSRRRQWLSHLLIGSNGERILRCTQRPVVTVTARTSKTGLYQRGCKHVLFATDFSPASLSALDYALAVTRQFQAMLSILHVVSAGNSTKAPDVSRKSVVQDSLRRVRALPVPDDTLRLVELGEVSEMILRTARELSADLIVMGLKRTTHVLIAAHSPATVAHQVLCQAQCPVLTVRA